MNPAATTSSANRITSGVSPGISWITTTPGPLPLRYVGCVTPSAVCSPRVQLSRRVMWAVWSRMRHLHALELVPDAAGRDAVRRDWQALRDAGLPSQLDHPSPTNEPHLTVVSAPWLPTDAIDVAGVRLGSLLPVRARASGLLLLGGEQLTVARAFDLDDDIVRKVLAVRVQVPDRQHDGWLPHVTLARRLDRADAQRAIDVLGYADVVLTFTGLRRWDPENRSAEVLAGR